MHDAKFSTLAICGFAASVFGLFLSMSAVEPAKHAVLYFGPNAKLAVKVVLQGKSVSLDLNSDGDVFDVGERFAQESSVQNIELRDPDGHTRYLIENLSVTSGIQPTLTINVGIQGAVRYRQYADIVCREIEQPPAIAHFHGPLTITPATIGWELPINFGLRTGPMPTELHALVGTMDAKRGCWTAVKVHDDGGKFQFEEGLFPVAEIEFPAKASGASPIVQRYDLHEFCCRVQFHAPIKVPEDAGIGTARLTISFPAWIGGKVLPTTTEIPVLAPSDLSSVP